MAEWQPLLSVGMPVFNGQRFLAEAIESILTQTFRDFELVISDNASTDATADIVESYASQDDRIRYYRNKTNQGAARNYNQAFGLSRGKYFKWAAHDDLCAPTFFQCCLDELIIDPEAVLSFSMASIIDSEGCRVGDFSESQALNSSSPHARYRRFHTVFQSPYPCYPVFGIARTDALKHTALIKRFVGSDRVLLGELSLRGKFLQVPEYLFFHREHDGNSIHAHRNFRDRIAWFDPQRKGQPHLTRWWLLREYLLSIHRSGLPSEERLLCFAQMGSWVFRNWHGLSRDLVEALITPFTSPFDSAPSDFPTRPAAP